MKSIVTAVVTVLLSATVFASDVENSHSTTTDTSKNPITGTEKTVKKTEAVAKGPHGETKTETKEVTKKKKSGKTEKTTETETKTTN